ncbi:MAG: GHMP kinase [Acidobacteria bacterium]|nr:GHMP kinase [Acidobacteriota bacterium]
MEISDSLQGVSVPADSPKAGRALELALDHFGARSLGARVLIDSDLPRGKGMASSTADVSGVIYAVARALGQQIEESEVARLCLQIEPTDGSAFSGLALFDHRTGSICERLGPVPPLYVAVLDFGGEVDTISFNAVDHTAVLKESEKGFEAAIRLVRHGLETGRVQAIGAAATFSALAHQRILSKPMLPKVIELSSELGACGVNVAHSGTVIGMLFSQSSWLALPSLQDTLFRELPELEKVYMCRVIAGGCYYDEVEGHSMLLHSRKHEE